jgi:hypothetical protein
LRSLNQQREVSADNPDLPQIATFIAVYANWGFAHIRGCGWGWAGIIWLFSIVTYLPLDMLKFAVRYIQSGKAWDNLINRKVGTPSFWTDCIQNTIVLGVFSVYRSMIAVNREG